MEEFTASVMKEPVYGSDFAELPAEQRVLFIVNVVHPMSLPLAVMGKVTMTSDVYNVNEVDVVDIRDPFPLREYDKYIWVCVPPKTAMHCHYSKVIAPDQLKQIQKKSIYWDYDNKDFNAPEAEHFGKTHQSWLSAMSSFITVKEACSPDEHLISAWHEFMKRCFRWYAGYGNWDRVSTFNFNTMKHFNRWHNRWIQMRHSPRNTWIAVPGKKVAVIHSLDESIFMLIRCLKLSGWSIMHKTSGVYGVVIAGESDEHNVGNLNVSV